MGFSLWIKAVMKIPVPKANFYKNVVIKTTKEV
jgi:hypothetical protein